MLIAGVSRQQGCENNLRCFVYILPAALNVDRRMQIEANQLSRTQEEEEAAGGEVVDESERQADRRQRVHNTFVSIVEKANVNTLAQVGGVRDGGVADWGGRQERCQTEGLIVVAKTP
jgi:hypothetical protein